MGQIFSRKKKGGFFDFHQQRSESWWSRWWAGGSPQVVPELVHTEIHPKTEIPEELLISVKAEVYEAKAVAIEELPRGIEGEPPRGIEGEPPRGIEGEPPRGIEGEPPRGIEGEPPRGIEGEPPGGIEGEPPTGIEVESPFPERELEDVLSDIVPVEARTEEPQEVGPTFFPVSEREKSRLPVLYDGPTRAFVSRSKVMIIMRGLPGSGKSYLVTQLQSIYPDSRVCSADLYFSRSGVYRFHPSKLKEAHAFSQQSALEACQEGVLLVIVDNTNVKCWEFSRYRQIATRFHYIVVIMESQTPWRFDPMILAQKNSHGVDEKTLQMRVNQWEQSVPYFYAWMLNSDDHNEVLSLGRTWLWECLQDPVFKEDFEEFANSSLRRLYGTGQVSPDASVLMSYFRRPHPDHLLHCTARFCGRGPPDSSALAYHNRPDVRLAIGRATELKIMCFVVTARSFAAKIQLNNEQAALFDRPVDEVPPDMSTMPPFNKMNGGGLSNTRSESSSPSQDRRKRKGSSPRSSSSGRRGSPKMSPSNPKLRKTNEIEDDATSAEVGGNIQKLPNPFAVTSPGDSSKGVSSLKEVKADEKFLERCPAPNWLGVPNSDDSDSSDSDDSDAVEVAMEERAHLTLGTAPDVSAVVAGFDVLEVSRLQLQNRRPKDVRVIPGARLVNYGNICRSPIAEAVFAELADAEEWDCDSAAIGPWHIGKAPDPRARSVMGKYDLKRKHKARQIRGSDFMEFDYIFGMDEDNMADLEAEKPKGSKAHLLLLGEFDPEGERIIRDPYYDRGSEGFEKCYQQCVRSIKGFLEKHGDKSS
ncbi:unnamed protein product [Cyprideis torosa]|uniref:2',3'-cyclic-nucleotide 3'-phosphodiesterase n=1 Tax=Cyprideis torosa TaxID=163714 RepID=A0A7R8WLE4_9CRUS|nr:unnamed protein product [Cyprideis torosa]CAG0897158.1 unnamed protein product [Cyprideis torosa]